MSSHDTTFSASIVDENGSLLLRLSGELDIGTVPMLRRAVDDLVEPELRVLTLDLADLTFLDVAGLRGLADARRTATSANADFKLRSPTDMTRRIIHLVDLPGLARAIEEPSEHPARGVLTWTPPIEAVPGLAQPAS